MPGIGSTGLYIDANDNHYAAQVVGKSFSMQTVWRDGAGKQIGVGTPPAGTAIPPGATSKVEPVESGNFEVVGTFRDGTTKLFSEVPPSQLFEPDATPASPASSQPAA